MNKEVFNFEIKINDYIIIYNPIQVNIGTTINPLFTMLPENTILRIDNITTGGQYKKPSVEIVFAFLTKKNKHINLVEKIPSKFNKSVYDLNKLEYSKIGEEDLDKIINTLLRKNKISILLEEKN